jgi:predicted dehydrogenase
MAARIRVGIVGATVTPGGSGWGANAHVPALKALSDSFELAAVCTAHPETAQASAEKFGASLAFSDLASMVARPDIDLVVVCVRVPKHHDLVMQALEAGKAVFCEWPLGANVAEAERMATLAAQRSLRTAVGLQARSDAAWQHARELVQQGYIGDVLSANLVNISQAIPDRGEGRVWQGRRTNGANTLTIAAGHAIDALCFVLGEFTELSARLATTITEWRNTDTGETMQVDSPDWIDVSGVVESGAQVSFHVATVPSNPSGNRFEIYGREGTLVVSGGTANVGPSQVRGARGKDALSVLDIPASKLDADADAVPDGPPRNVGRAYARIAQAFASTSKFEPDFAHAVRRHQLIEALERSSADGRAVQLRQPAAVS